MKVDVLQAWHLNIICMLQKLTTCKWLQWFKFGSAMDTEVPVRFRLTAGNIDPDLRQVRASNIAHGAIFGQARPTL